MNSLGARLIAAAGIVLLVFVGLTGLALERAVRERAEQAQHDRLQGLVYAMLGAAEIRGSDGFELAAGELPEAALSRPGSGLYAVVRNADGEIVWRSPSLIGELPLVQPPAVGDWRYRQVEATDTSWLILSFGFRWMLDDGESRRYTFTVAQDAAPLIAQMQRFRGVLWGWLGLAGVALLLTLLAVLRWGLAPLRRLTRALTEIEAGRAERVAGDFPAEVRPVVNNLNAMLASEHKRLQRYRNALGDLAHSLKTPVAVLRNLAQEQRLPDDVRSQMDGQLRRINEILDYQLQRAAAAGKRALTPPVPLRAVIEKVAGALRKVYYDRGTLFVIEVPADLHVVMDEADLTEVLGNVLDNAAKYGRREVRVTGRREDEWVRLLVDDDGEGFPADAAERLLARGARADTRQEGQGIGLAVAAEIVASYAGAIDLAGSPQGGGRVALSLPARAY